MSADDFARLRPYFELVALNLRDVLVEPGQPITHVYFVEYGLASVVAMGLDGEPIEVGHIGREGMSGQSVLLGVDRTPDQTFMQIAGSGLRMPVEALRAGISESPVLHALLLRFVQTTIIQLAQTALANGRFIVQQRLARWLLMCHDRLDGDDLPLTHEFLSLMLGVRRASVTEALHLLEGVAIVKAGRGHVEVLNREKLEEIAGACYGVPEREYRRLIG